MMYINFRSGSAVKLGRLGFQVGLSILSMTEVYDWSYNTYRWLRA